MTRRTQRCRANKENVLGRNKVLLFLSDTLKQFRHRLSDLFYKFPMFSAYVLAKNLASHNY